MGLATFIGGIHPYEGKELSEDKPIKVLEPLQGEIMVYPLRLFCWASILAHLRNHW